MKNEKLYTETEICKALGISTWTLKTWYMWQSKELANNPDMKPYLPEPYKMAEMKGRPRRWNDKMLKELKEYQNTIVKGRNGAYGKYSNPVHYETKKYKKSLENTCETK